MKVLVFGNPLVPEDSLALKVAEKLAGKFEFKILDAVEDIESEGRNLVILDVAEGIGKATLLESLDALQTNPVYSMHDFDISLTLKLLKKIGKLDSVKIVAIPKNYGLEKAAKEAEVILRSILPSKSS